MDPQALERFVADVRPEARGLTDEQLREIGRMNVKALSEGWTIEECYAVTFNSGGNARMAEVIMDAVTKHLAPEHRFAFASFKRTHEGGSFFPSYLDDPEQW